MTTENHIAPSRLPRVIAVNRFYKPDHSSTSQMLTDLMEHLGSRGHPAVVVTSRLKYEGGKISSKRESLGGVEVRRIWTTAFGRKNLAGRMIDYLTFHTSAFVTLLVVARRGDFVLVKTDPPLMSVSAAVASQLKGARQINWCQDLFPEVADGVGMKWASSWFGRLLRRMRNWSLRKADFNATIHDKMAEHLIAEGVAEAQIMVLPNWADASIAPVDHSNNPLRAEWQLQDKFVIGYSGNLGRAHLPETVSQLVRTTRDIDGLVWLFIGGGAGTALVMQETAGSPNVIFKPYQPRTRLSESLSVADYHLVSLDPDCEGAMVPSKVYGVRRAGRPVIFLGDADGATARDLSQAGAGVVLDPERPDRWQQTITELVDNWRRGAAIQKSGDWLHGWTAQHGLEAWEIALRERSGLTDEARGPALPAQGCTVEA